MKKITTFLTFCFLLGFAQLDAQTNCQAWFMHYSNPSGSNTIQFLDSSFIRAGNPTYQWNFGDGNTSTLQNPLHTYTTGGYYVVQLNLTTSLGCSSSYLDTIFVGGGCTANYSYSVNPSNAVSFYNQSYPNTGSSYSWDFGDGNSSTSTNPVHTYSNAGIYVAILNVTTASGNTCSKYDTVYVNYCNAFFTSTAGNNGNVTFNNYSAASNQTVYAWDFGDGSNQVYKFDKSAVSHTYTTSGLYWITLSLADSVSGCISTYSDSVYIQLNTNPSCFAHFNVVKDTSSSFGVILYNNSTTGQTHTYSWDFGDGTVINAKNPQHSYANFGTYNVCLTVRDQATNCVSTYCDSVGMDSLGNLKSPGFSVTVRNPLITGIDEQESKQELSIYPNPASTNLNLDLSGYEGTFNYEVKDISGKTVVVRNQIQAGSVKQINVEGLQNGFYFLLIDQNGERQINKFLISR